MKRIQLVAILLGWLATSEAETLYITARHVWFPVPSTTAQGGHLSWQFQSYVFVDGPTLLPMARGLSLLHRVPLANVSGPKPPTQQLEFKRKNQTPYRCYDTTGSYRRFARLCLRLYQKGFGVEQQLFIPLERAQEFETLRLDQWYLPPAGQTLGGYYGPADGKISVKWVDEGAEAKLNAAFPSLHPDGILLRFSRAGVQWVGDRALGHQPLIGLPSNIQYRLTLE